jgi:hypothetical protein
LISRIDRWLRQPLLAERPASANRGARWLLLLVWLAATLALAWNHVPWRDEARAWSLTLMGDSWIDMLRGAQGEGHPYLWYILLRAGHNLFGVPEVLWVTGLVIGIAAAALLVLRGPFRIGVLALLLFSMYLGFEYTVIARNYGIAALLMLAIAASWIRIRDSLWLGLLLLLLCNTNVPSVFMAGALLLYRLLELWGEEKDLRSPQWRRLFGNVVLVGLGTLLCFVAVYPPANDAAAATNAQSLSLTNLAAALFSSARSFIEIGFGEASPMTQLVLFGSLLLFALRPQALIAAAAGLVCLKLFYFFVYPAYYRHSALFFVLMITLVWIEAGKLRPQERAAGEPSPVVLFGTWMFALLLAVQCALYLRYPVTRALNGQPFSHAADLARILERPEYRGSLLMIDPDTMGESVVYQTGRAYWLIRQDRLGRITPLTSGGNKLLTLDRLLEQAEALHVRTGRPVVIALLLPLDSMKPGKYDVLFKDYTVLTPASVARFRARTRPIASLRNAQEDENYDVYAYPR